MLLQNQFSILDEIEEDFFKNEIKAFLPSSSLFSGKSKYISVDQFDPKKLTFWFLIS